MAASIAILIYLEIPRVAFERQRDKEALLIDRGEQYARAIELFVRKTNRYPQTLEDLEQAQTIRFLRRRYKDPMTGKDEWRLIHMGANGQYLDSKVHKAGGALNAPDNGPSVLASKIQGVGQSATIISQDAQVSAALQKRASDRISPGTPGAGSSTNSGDASQGSPDASQDPNQQQNNVAAGQGANGSGASGNSGGSAGSGGQAAATPVFGSVLPQQGQQGQQDASASGSGSGATASGSAASQGSSGQPQAIQAIQSMLGANRNLAPIGGSNATLGGGLAGVATTVEMEGIRRYKDHSNYSEWEFIYDPNDAQRQAAGAQQSGAANAGGNAANSAFGGMPGGAPAPASGGPH